MKLFSRLLGLSFLSLMAFGFSQGEASTGELGPWSYTTAMNTERHMGNGVVAYNGYIYATGGTFWSDGSVEYAQLNTDGTIGTWIDTSSMSGPRFWHGVARTMVIYTLWEAKEAAHQ